MRRFLFPDSSTNLKSAPGKLRAPPPPTLFSVAGDAVSAEGAASDDHAMALALEEAEAALGHRDVPVGAVVMVADLVLARRHNERERTGDPTAHAEILALRDAARALGTWRLDACTLVVTLEPCAMCAGALVASRLGRLVFAAADPKAGACGSLYNLCADPRLNHELSVTGGVRAVEASRLLSAFFAGLRTAGDEA